MKSSCLKFYLCWSIFSLQVSPGDQTTKKMSLRTRRTLREDRMDASHFGCYNTKVIIRRGRRWPLVTSLEPSQAYSIMLQFWCFRLLCDLNHISPKITTSFHTQLERQSFPVFPGVLEFVTPSPQSLDSF